MNKPSKGSDLFIVDNSISGWTTRRYLHDWCEIAKSMDIATGYFEIGALLALEDKWQQLEKIRILMGDEVTGRTKQALLKAIKERAEFKLDTSIEDEKEDNPFLNGVDAIVDAMKHGRIECRVYNKDRFHAKAYITHAKLDVVGAQALVGSSNFTQPGLTKNIELNIQVQSGREVAQLQEWYETHWEDAEDVSEEILKVVSRHTELFTPFDIYAKALQSLLRSHEMTAGEWDRNESRLFQYLDRYQQEAYWKLIEIARRHGGAFLCDGVGLGKTFVGLMLIERLVLHDRKRVVLFAPKAATESVWQPHLEQWLPHIHVGGTDGGAVFSSFHLASHSDFARANIDDIKKSIADFADVIIIDEGHHFRNPGRQGDPETGEKRSRYWQLYDLIHASEPRKRVYFLTATPINNRLGDFRHMAELFTGREEAFFAKTLGVHGLTSHFNRLEKNLKDSLGSEEAQLGENLEEVREKLSVDVVFGALVVQRSRKYVRESQQQEKEKPAIFPTRQKPEVAEYSVRKSYGALLDKFEKAFQKDNPLFTLSIYYPLAYYIGDDETIEPFDLGRQKQVVGLIRTSFLKRFESSVRAFELSLDRLLRKLLAFLEVNCEPGAERVQLEKWQQQNAEILQYAYQQQLDIWGKEEDEEDLEEDIVPVELLAQFEKLPRKEYNVPGIIEDTFSDLDQVVDFLKEAKKFKSSDDDKLKKLLRLLKTKQLTGQKVLIFSEFADTVRYLAKELGSNGIDGLDFIDGGRSGRADFIRRFSPYYNGTSTGELKDRGVTETRVLISSDVLSEGLNLQDACFLINYDIHWNPVRLMQRIGRIDRRLNPDIEKQLIKDHPEIASHRGTVKFWNFLPPEELNSLLTLYNKVTQKTLLISETLGIESGKLLTPDDRYNDTKVFNAFQGELEGQTTVEERLRLDFQQMLNDMPELAERLEAFPGSIFSGRKRLPKGILGVFFCYTLPAWDTEKEDYSLEAGPTHWYLYDLDKKTILEEPGDIVRSIESKKNHKRRCEMEQKTLIEMRAEVRKHIRNTYEKKLDLPLDAPKPRLDCWMELNEG